MNVKMEAELARLLSSNEVLLEHSFRVFLTAREVARQIRLPVREESDLLTAALFHDIGKGLWTARWHEEPICRLGADAVMAMRAHPLRGAGILADLGFSPGVVRLVREHHERPGGRGYPYGIEPSRLSLVLAACDVYSACTEDRPYREKPLSRDEALKEVAKFAPPEVLDALGGKVPLMEGVS